MIQEEEKKYPGSEEDLYAIADMAWQNCNNLKTRFQTFKVKYTPEYITAMVAAVQAAQDLPNVNARRAKLANKRTKLLAAAKVCGTYWQSLSAYIDSSFDKAELDSMRKLAGSDYYTSISRENWLGTDTMLIMASAFISSYMDDLKDGDMPGSFPADFDAKRALFDAALKAYSDLKTDIQTNTNNKVAANNAVYDALRSMLTDAKAIFANEPKTKKQFTYTALAKMVGKKGTGGYRIVVKDAATLLPVTTATFLFQPGNVDTFVNAKGIAAIRLAQGVYNATVTAPGYNTVELTSLQVNANVMHRLEVLVQKAVAVA